MQKLLFLYQVHLSLRTMNWRENEDNSVFMLYWKFYGNPQILIYPSSSDIRMLSLNASPFLFCSGMDWPVWRSNYLLLGRLRKIRVGWFLLLFRNGFLEKCFPFLYEGDWFRIGKATLASRLSTVYSNHRNLQNLNCFWNWTLRHVSFLGVHDFFKFTKTSLCLSLFPLVETQ